MEPIGALGCAYPLRLLHTPTLRSPDLLVSTCLRVLPWVHRTGLDEPTVDAGGQAVADALITAGDKMLRAIMFHSAEGHLSEQFDKVSEYEKSVEDLMWSYAAFTSALRTRPS